MIDAIKLTEELNNPKILGNFPKAVARVSNYRPVMPLRDLKVNSYGEHAILECKINSHST